METYLLAHDLGTSGNKAVLYKADGSLAASVLCEYPTYYPVGCSMSFNAPASQAIWNSSGLHCCSLFQWTDDGLPSFG